jgi:oligopeptidase B
VKDPEILAHLEAENAWFQANMAPRQPLIDRLFAEMRGRIKEADKSVPQKDGDWLYWIEYEEGAEYKKWWRRPVGAADDGSADELILDEVALAQGHDYFRLGAISVSHDGRLLAWSVDDNGSERFTARIKVIATGEILPDEIPGTNSGLIWVKGDTGLVYSLANENWRTDNVRLHWLGQPLDTDVELYHEDDEGFRAGAALSANEEWLILSTGDHETSEVRLIPANDPLAAPILVRPREGRGIRCGPARGHAVHPHQRHPREFPPGHRAARRSGQWTTLIAGSDDFYLTGFELFRDFYVVEGRVRGLDRIEVRYYDDPARIEPIAFPEASYEASLGDNPEWATQTLRVGYESMVSPASVYDYDVASRT